jgi:hypothetical protein
LVITFSATVSRNTENHTHHQANPGAMVNPRRRLAPTEFPDPGKDEPHGQKDDPRRPEHAQERA